MRGEQRPPAGARAIELTRGWVAWVDEEDYPLISERKWIGQRDEHRTYATASHGRLKMHRLVTGAKVGTIVDHVVDRSALGVCDNRKENLRFALNGQNISNGRKQPGASSIFKGVSWHKRIGKWSATIRKDKHLTHLGYFDVEAHAAYAYDLAAVRLHGEFALCNFPSPGAQRWIFGEVP